MTNLHTHISDSFRVVKYCGLREEGIGGLGSRVKVWSNYESYYYIGFA
jgi:hypothetical protein